MDRLNSARLATCLPRNFGSLEKPLTDITALPLLVMYIGSLLCISLTAVVEVEHGV